ncbi:acyltransferase [Streptomyces himalayensis]|uniref:acyltransferase n=1 Tax=Streptomyces himalayensis TaxID=2820085 RepID=UPI0028682EC5|nr:DapH/DapD/GlmU-related protein [Streptomyces himalayensis]
MPKSKNMFSSLTAWRRRVAQRAVHAGWAWVQWTGAVTAERPGRLRFGALGHGTRLAFPQGTVFGEPWIHLGDHCIIGEQVTLTAGMMPDLDLGPDPILRIGDGVVLGRGSHVIADTTVTIGSDCYFGPYVYVTSTNHSYDDPHEPIGKQWPRMERVEIGPGCWIGTGAVILPGARIGRNVVVAAGAVVRGSVPDHAVVAGAPARVVRRWDPERGWQPPLRTPAPVPIPEGITPEQLLALAELAPGLEGGSSEVAAEHRASEAAEYRSSEAAGLGGGVPEARPADAPREPRPAGSAPAAESGGAPPA